MFSVQKQDAEIAIARVTAQKVCEASKQPYKAKVVELECLLQAKNAHIAHLEAEMEAQARSHRVRLIELQEGCHNKVRQVQQMHREQLLAAQNTSAATLAAAAGPAASTVVAEEMQALTTMFETEQAKRAAECSTLQDKLVSAEQQQEALRQLLKLRSDQSHSLRQQEQQSRQALAESTAAQAELASNHAILQERCAGLQAQLVELQQRSTSASQTDPAAVFQVLEQQLTSITGLVRQKEQQIAALQQTVRQQCDERTMMQINIMQLTAVRESNAVKQQSSVTDASPPLEQRTPQSSQAGQIQMPDNAQASAAQQSCTPTQIVPGAKVSVDRAAQRKDRLNRLASASEQQQGKSGLLGRIMATSSTTGKTVFD